MKHLFCLALGLAGLMTCAEGLASPEKKLAPIKAAISPNGTWTLTVSFTGGERANVIVVGDGKAYLGLYIFDAKKNCVARDDDVNGKYLDDRWVIWFPPTTQSYKIEIRNLSPQTAVCDIAVR